MMNNSNNYSKLPANNSVDSIDELRSLANTKLVESGERDRLVNQLRNRLLECGWRDNLAANCKRVVKERGIDNITVDDLVQEVTPVARSSVPNEIKQDLVDKIKAFLTAQLAQETGSWPGNDV